MLLTRASLADCAVLVAGHARTGEAQLLLETGWAKEIWDMAAVAFVLNHEWTPSVLVPTPILTDNVTYSIDRSRHVMRYVTYVRRNPIMQDFIRKLAAANK